MTQATDMTARDLHEGHVIGGDPTMERLEDQIRWYDKRSARNQRWFKTLKVISIISGALVPLLAPWQAQPTRIGSGILGVIVVVSEGLQQLNQYHQNWIGYRSTCEALKHEKYLYLAKAGPYAGAADPHALLADRVESQVSQEHAKWVSTTELDKKESGEKK
jgi:hypothetical protein